MVVAVRVIRGRRVMDNSVKVSNRGYLNGFSSLTFLVSYYYVIVSAEAFAVIHFQGGS